MHYFSTWGTLQAILGIECLRFVIDYFVGRKKIKSAVTKERCETATFILQQNGISVPWDKGGKAHA